ncbi:hypothetical protein GRI34_08715 [Erythrobacter aquimaris]|uniref:Methyltransferase n=2 Tax=Qipengyuania aquimaris TaxID=255984 RepID=A0A6I4TPX0_9SPHN|nr:hypothetical protein [Qipengyuania aquimaris]
MRTLLAAAAAATTLAIAAPALADDHAADAKLEAVLADDLRDGDRARDQYRNPAETLAFFQVEPDMTVVEWGPGGGWYTRVLAPYLMGSGTYVALNGDSDERSYPNRAAEARSKGWTERFKESMAEAMEVETDDVKAFEIDEVPEDMEGTADRVMIVRSLHGLWNGNDADTVLKGVYDILKDDGMVGVVQHRAPADAAYSTVNPARGYMREADVIKLFELHGFELAAKSEINANPKDPANWEGGVWTLPPTLRYGDQDRARYEAIGESDRMTLLFRKR